MEMRGHVARSGRLQAERELWAEERSPVAVAQAGRTPDPSRVPSVTRPLKAL